MADEPERSLFAQAAHLSALGQVYRNLASMHRSASESLRQRSRRVEHGWPEQALPHARLTYERHFKKWIFIALECSWRAERLLEFEVDLARRNGVTWEEIAGTLGMSRQSAWHRFTNKEVAAKRKARIDRVRMTYLGIYDHDINRSLEDAVRLSTIRQELTDVMGQLFRLWDND